MLFPLFFLFAPLVHADITSNLIFRTDFEEGSGSTVIDSVSSNNGTTQNSPTYITGQVGKFALQFNGSTQYVAFGAPSVFNLGAGNFTISAWIKPTTVSTAGVIIGKDSNATNGRSFGLIMDNTGAGTLGCFFNSDDVNGVDAETNNPVLTANVWNHVVCTRTADQVLNIYINGSSVAVTITGHGTGAVQVNTTDFEIARRVYSGFQEPFPGNIDDVRIYSRALSSSDVTQLFNFNDPSASVLNSFSVFIGRVIKVFSGRSLIVY